MKDPYSVLGVPKDASEAQIRYAYRQALRENPSGESPVEVKERMDEVEEAYRTLTDPRRGRVDGAPTGVQVPEREPAPGLPVLEEAEEKRSRNPFTRMTHKLPRPWRIALDWVLTIAGAVLIVLAIKAWVVNPYRIPSSSMEPTLHCARSAGPASGCEAHFSDRVLANRFIYHLRDPHRNEIVVFNTPPKAQLECGAGGTFVKRLIGLPGEKVQEKNGRFFINGKRLDDSSYIEPGRRDDRTGVWFVPKNSYFFVGDNRTQSCDSRRWGSVPRGNLIGPVFAIYWPPNRIHVDTPGPLGAGILAILFGVIVVFIVLTVRKRRRAHP